jgi:nitrous oxide reductase
MIVAKDSTTPKPVKTVEEKELDQARKIHRRNRSSVIALSRYLTEFKINKQIVSMADRKLFLVRNLKAVHRLRLLQYMKIEDEFEKKAQEAALETKKDEFGLYPWERRAQEQQYKKLIGHTDEEVNSKQEKAPEKKEKVKEKKKEKKEKPKEEKKRKSVGTEPPARKRKSLPKDATKTEPKARKVEHARIAKPKKMKSAYKKEEKTPEKVSLSSEFNNFDWEGIGVRKSKALALHSLNNNTSSATNVKKKARTSL